MDENCSRLVAKELNRISDLNKGGILSAEEKNRNVPRVADIKMSLVDAEMRRGEREKRRSNLSREMGMQLTRLVGLLKLGVALNTFQDREKK